MKPFIHSILLFFTLCLLLTGVARGQTTSLRRVRIESATGAAGTPYEVLALRNLTTYPITVSGTKSWTTAVATGQISLTVLGTGCVIAQGSAPPPIPPTCTVTPPVATTQVITIAAYSQTQNGPENRFIYTAASGSSPTSTELTFSGAPIAASNYAYSLVYQTNEGGTPGQGAIRVNGGSDQATFNLEVASGGTRTVTGTLNLAMGNNTIAFTLNTGSLPYQVRSLSISRASSTTTVVTGGTSTTSTSTTSTISYSRVFVDGNSITANWITSDNTRGLDASTPENDYFHKLTNNIKTLNSSADVRQFASWRNIGPDCGGLKLDASDGPFWEQHYWSLPGNPAYCGFTGADSLDRYNLVAAWKPDLIIIRIGENVTDLTHNFEYHLKRKIDKLKSQNPTATVVLTTSVWQSLNSTQVAVSTIMQSIGAQRGYAVADLSNITGATSGTQNHPNDAAMQVIADRIWAAIPKSITTTPTTTTNLTAQGLNADFTAPADQGWNILTTREKYIETSALKIGFLRGGAVISYGALKRDNRNLVNSNQVYYTDKSSDFRYNTFTDDLGRQIMFFSDYMSPGPNDNAGQGFILKNGKKTSTGYGGYVFNTGANTVQGGSLFPALDFSPILSSATYVHPQRGTEFYAKTRAQIWGLGQEAGWVVGEQWCSFPLPNCLFCFTRRTVEVRDAARFAEQRNFDSQSQENPCLYLIAPLTQKLIDLPGESRKNIYNGIADSPKYFTTTSKIGAYEGNGGTGVTYYSPVQGAVGSFQAVGTTGNWGDNASSYIQGAPRRNYDNPGITEEYHYMVWGTETEANAAIAQLPGIDQSYDFDFTKENMLWFNINGPLKKESAGWTFYMNANTDNGVTSYNGQMWSPVRAWNASGVTTVNFDISVTGTTKLKLIWQKPGLNYDNQYSKEFTVVGDGQFHTVSVFTSDPNFNGTISTIGFGPGSTTGTGAKVVIHRIWKN